MFWTCGKNIEKTFGVFLFADFLTFSIIFCKEGHVIDLQSTNILLEIIRKFSTGYKFNTQKSIPFLHTSNNAYKINFLKIPFTIALKT